MASWVMGQILAIFEVSALHCRRNVAKLAFEPENVHDYMLTLTDGSFSGTIVAFCSSGQRVSGSCHHQRLSQDLVVFAV